MAPDGVAPLPLPLALMPMDEPLLCGRWIPNKTRATAGTRSINKQVGASGVPAEPGDSPAWTLEATAEAKAGWMKRLQRLGKMRTAYM